MPQLPRGVPFIDLLVPAGARALVSDLQTRIDLVSGGAWTVLADDGSMEQSLVPMQPLRGTLDRVQVYRNQPYAPGESLQAPASLAVEVAIETQASLAVLGVNGVYAWGVVLVEDVRWLHGLVLLDWLYNPRLDEAGEIIEEVDPDTVEAVLSRKLAVFKQLWTPSRSAALGAQLPPGALQEVESHYALMLLGPDGAFDPRFWQGFSMQVALAEVRAFAGAGDAPAGAQAAPAAAHAPAPPAPPAPVAPAEPDDGLTPLARAERDAEARREAAASADAAAPEPAPVPEPAGPAVRWAETSSGPVVWIPAERMDAAFLRRLRDGETDGLGRGERPGPQRLELWMEAGACFASEVPFLSRLFLEGVPMHGGSWSAAAEEVDGLQSVRCHLPRVSPVRAVLVPARGGADRRILVCSAGDLSPTEIAALAQ